jgi:hypothetical protein
MERQNWTGRARQAVLDRQNWTGITGQAGQARQNNIGRSRLPTHGCHHKTARIRHHMTWKKGEDSQKRTTRKGQPDQDRHDRHNKTARTGLLGQNSRDRTASTGLPAY